MLRDGSDKTGLRKKALEIGLENCYISEISLAELSSGAYRMDSERGFFELSFIRQILTPIPFGRPGCSDSEVFGRLKAQLYSAGVPLDDMDLLIASTALAEGMILVTHNTKHFSRIPGLILDDWLSSF